MHQEEGIAAIAGQQEAVPGSAASRLLSGFASPFLAERERWMLWLPVVLGGGIGCYFLLKAEPPLWAGSAGICIALSLGLILYRTLNGRLVALLLCSARSAMSSTRRATSDEAVACSRKARSSSETMPATSPESSCRRPIVLPVSTLSLGVSTVLAVTFSAFAAVVP